MAVINFATIGTSKITQKFLSAAKECAGFKLAAVYSRDIKKAEQFAGEQRAERFYDSLDMLAADKDVEAVYVASPNYMHYKHVMKLLKAGKHVFCEKAIASNYAEAEEMFRTAQERHLVLLEAVRPVFDPGMQAIKYIQQRMFCRGIDGCWCLLCAHTAVSFGNAGENQRFCRYASKWCGRGRRYPREVSGQDCRSIVFKDYRFRPAK